MNPLVEYGEDFYDTPKKRKQEPVLGRVDSYDAFVRKLAKYPTRQANPEVVAAMYCALGLTGEAGEASEKIKKWHRDGKVDKLMVARELGDVLYYLTALANLMGYTLAEVEELNREKLTDRLNRGKIHGSGDTR
jgi:NTP pyrophosphatase (non-canonical NTP hydrolase)